MSFASPVASRPIVLWQMDRVWGLPNGSPFCMKLETWLRMASLPYEARVIQGPPKSKSGKVPYVERSDGSMLADSSVIIDTLTREHGVQLDAGLTGTDHAIGTLLQRTLEEDLYFTVLYDRWVDDAGWSITAPAYFSKVPWLLRVLVLPFIRRQIKASAHGQGVARLTPAQRIFKARTGLDAIAHLLGDKPFFFGTPSRYDAMAYAFLANMLWAPIPSALADAARSHSNLVGYCERMKATYWAGWTP